MSTYITNKNIIYSIKINYFISNKNPKNREKMSQIINSISNLSSTIKIRAFNNYYIPELEKTIQKVLKLCILPDGSLHTTQKQMFYCSELCEYYLYHISTHQSVIIEPSPEIGLSNEEWHEQVKIKAQNSSGFLIKTSPTSKRAARVSFHPTPTYGKNCLSEGRSLIDQYKSQRDTATTPIMLTKLSRNLSISSGKENSAHHTSYKTVIGTCNQVLTMPKTREAYRKVKALLRENATEKSLQVTVYFYIDLIVNTINSTLNNKMDNTIKSRLYFKLIMAMKTKKTLNLSNEYHLALFRVLLSRLIKMIENFIYEDEQNDILNKLLTKISRELEDCPSIRHTFQSNEEPVKIRRNWISRIFRRH